MLVPFISALGKKLKTNTALVILAGGAFCGYMKNDIKHAGPVTTGVLFIAEIVMDKLLGDTEEVDPKSTPDGKKIEDKEENPLPSENETKFISIDREMEERNQK